MSDAWSTIHHVTWHRSGFTNVRPAPTCPERACCVLLVFVFVNVSISKIKCTWKPKLYDDLWRLVLVTVPTHSDGAVFDVSDVIDARNTLLHSSIVLNLLLQNYLTWMLICNNFNLITHSNSIKFKWPSKLCFAYCVLKHKNWIIRRFSTFHFLSTRRWCGCASHQKILMKYIFEIPTS